MALLEVENLCGGYRGRPVIDQLSFSVEQGELFGVIGPNGSGKSTLLKLLTRILLPTSGVVKLQDKNLFAYTRPELARTIAVLPQTIHTTFSYTVKEIVAMGRYPHQVGLFKTLTTADQAVIEQAMTRTKIAHLSAETLETLSGGERQRVYLAQALAQEARLLCLDEPTNHLDLNHQKMLLDHLKTWVKEKQFTVISIFHDLNLAGLYCDRLLLLKEGKKAALGKPREVLTPIRLERVYETEVETMEHRTASGPLTTVTPAPERKAAPALLLKPDGIYWSQPVRTLYSASEDSGWRWMESVKLRYSEREEKNYSGTLQQAKEATTGSWKKESVSFGKHTLTLAVHKGLSQHWIVYFDGRLSDRAFINLFSNICRKSNRNTINEYGQTNESAQTEGHHRFVENGGVIVAAAQMGEEYDFCAMQEALAQLFAKWDERHEYEQQSLFSREKTK